MESLFSAYGAGELEVEPPDFEPRQGCAERRETGSARNYSDLVGAHTLFYEGGGGVRPLVAVVLSVYIPPIFETDPPSATESSYISGERGSEVENWYP